jgi:hypothetical protein
MEPACERAIHDSTAVLRLKVALNRFKSVKELKIFSLSCPVWTFSNTRQVMLPGAGRPVNIFAVSNYSVVQDRF